MRQFRFPLPVSLLQSTRRSVRAGEMDAKTVIMIVLAGVGGFALLGCAGVMLLLLPAVQGARNAARVTQSRNNLKIIGLGLHNYHDAHEMFPPGGTYAEDDTPHHSWQSMLLPYIDQAPLYKQIDFDRPWTDAANGTAFRWPVVTFLHPSQTQTTNPQGLALSHYAGNAHVLLRNKSLSIRDFSDGEANTVIAGEVASGFKPWGDPTNVRDPGSGSIGDSNDFGSNLAGSDTFQVLMADGSVRNVSVDIDADVLKARATPDGREANSKF